MSDLVASTTIIATTIRILGCKWAGPSSTSRRGSRRRFSARGLCASEEAAYARSQDREKLKKLRESIAKQREHLNEVEKALNDVDVEKK
ncbi:hypothetical protein V8E36_009371 [Tilletia maclaganii]